MCAWHAAEASDKTWRATTTSILNITESLSQFAVFDFSRKHYKSLFQGDPVDFDLLAYPNKTIFLGVIVFVAAFVAYRYKSLVSFIGPSRHSSCAKEGIKC